MSGEIVARFRVRHPGFALDASVTLPGKGVSALFGPSGSGKTTILRCIAGLERTADGYLEVNGEVWQEGKKFLPVHRRPVGYVFQEASLFPHRDVRGNLEFGRKRVPQSEHRLTFDQVVDLLGVEHLLERRVERLSGGERQRVAIARALLTSPRLLLMDEPLSALDVQSKADILPYLERLHDELSLPVVYVSHAPNEVARLADYLVLVKEGGVLAEGPLAQLMTRPDLPIARDEEAGAVVETVVEAHDAEYGLSRLAFEGGHFWKSGIDHAVGSRLRLLVQARDVSITLVHSEQSSMLNILPAKVVEVADLGSAHALARLMVGSTPLLARITRKSRHALTLAPGQEVWAQVKATAVLS